MKETLLNISNKIISFFQSENKNPDEHIVLKSLRPTKGLSEHPLYVRELVKAADNPEIQNVALTGSYGAGKSSILRDFLDNKNYRDKALQISFSSLGANIQDYIKKDTSSKGHERLNNLANLIQKEIVKQILFKEKTKNIPYSRFRRVSSPSSVLLLTVSLIIVTALFAIIIANGWLNLLLDALLLHDFTLRVVEGGILYFTLVCSILLFLLTVGSKIRIDKIGNSTISLSLSGKNSYFDEYLDEIIYFFEAAKYKVVIFEDIDRFDNLYIFENLRQLNTILNNSKQIKGKVTFIYAVKDSIFSKDTTDDEATDSNDGDHRERSANRTKFFDLIIPVVPFITNISSRDHILNEFDEVYREELKGPVSIISKYVTDMRLVKNIYNEFSIFKEKIALDGSGLSLDKLFAIVAYKNWNLDDFEKIKNGESIIDKALEVYSDFVELESSNLASQINARRNQIKNTNTLDSRAKQLGQTLTSYISSVISQLNSALLSITLNGTTYEEADLVELDFWKEVVAKGEENTLIINYRPPQIGYTLSLTLSTQDLRSVTRDPLDENEWKKHDTEKLQQEVDELIAQQAELTYLDIAGLLKKYDSFQIKLSEAFEGKIAKDKMAWELIEAGYINDEFAHYTSIFHEYSMSLKARNFWLNNIRHNKTSIFHKFEGDQDIEAMLSETSPIYFKDKSMYNLEIVDFLLTVSDDGRVGHIISNLAGGDEEDVKFIDAYLKNGKRVDEFIKALAAIWPEVFMHIIDHKDMDDKKKSYLISLSLEYGDGKLNYYTGNSITSFINEHAKDIITLTRTKNGPRLEIAGTILETLKVSFASMEGLSDLAKGIIESRQLYSINEANLQEVLGHSQLPLDEIKIIDEMAYSHILANLQDYINLYIDSKAFTLVGKEGFESVIDDVSKVSIEHLDAILSKADLPNCIINDINKLPTNTWSALVKNVIASNTLSNILAYFNFYNVNVESDKVISDELVEYLNTAEVVTLDKEYEEFEHEQVKAFVVAVINSDKLHDKVKISIAKECYTKKYIAASAIKKKEGSFFGELLGNDIIEDSSMSFEYIRDLPWDTKKNYIINSSKFTDYIEDLSLTTDELNLLVNDLEIPDKIKLHIIDNLTTYLGTLSISATDRLAKVAVANNLVLGEEKIKILAGGATSSTIVQLLNNASLKLTLDDYISILGVVGGEYQKLTQNNKRPSFDNNEANIALITRLKELGAVSSYDINTKIKVTMKAKWR